MGKFLYSKNFTHFMKGHVKQFSHYQKSLFSKTLFKLGKPQTVKNCLLFTGLGTSCYVGAQSFDSCYQIEFANIFKSFVSRFIANCKEDPNKNSRTKHYEKSVGKSEKNSVQEKNDDFDWTQFFKLLWKEKSYFLLAVCVSWH